MKTIKRYSGVVIPVVTPLTADHKLDKGAVEKIFTGFHQHEVFPFILGTTGESASLPFSLKKEFMEVAGRYKKSDDLLYAGISSNVLAESITLARHAFDHGADVVVATLPTYFSLPETAMLRYFEQLAEAVAGPLVIYNIPATTHMSVPLNVIDHLSHHPDIVGVKDSERSDDRLQESVQRWKGRNDFSHFLGWAARSAEAILKGSDGLVPSTGNFHPGLYAALYGSAIGGNRERALQLQEVSDALGDLYQQGRTLGESLWALKVIMNHLGLCEAYVMPPLYAQSSEDENALLSAAAEIINKNGIQF